MVSTRSSLQSGIFAIAPVVYKVFGKFAHFSIAYDLYYGTCMLVNETCTSIVVKDPQFQKRKKEEKTCKFHYQHRNLRNLRARTPGNWKNCKSVVLIGKYNFLGVQDKFWGVLGKIAKRQL